MSSKAIDFLKSKVVSGLGIDNEVFEKLLDSEDRSAIDSFVSGGKEALTRLVSFRRTLGVSLPSIRLSWDTERNLQ